MSTVILILKGYLIYTKYLICNFFLLISISEMYFVQENVAKINVITLGFFLCVIILGTV